MSYSLIRLQEDRLFQLANGATLIQDQTLAVNVAPYRYIVPFVHVKTSFETSLPGSGATNIAFTFSTAAGVFAPSEGNRFRELSNGSVTVNDQVGMIVSGSWAEGRTFGPTQLSTGGFQCLQDVGGLLIWKCVNSSGTAVAFRADIYLVCRD